MSQALLALADILPFDLYKKDSYITDILEGQIINEHLSRYYVHFCIPGKAIVKHESLLFATSLVNSHINGRMKLIERVLFADNVRDSRGYVSDTLRIV